jgi:putative acetyltransferase
VTDPQMGVHEQRELEIRPAGRSDLDSVARLWHESASSMDGPAADVPPREALRERIDLELRSGWELHVAVRGRRVVGMLAIKPDDGVLDQIFVLPGEQGRGVGKALLRLARQRMQTGFTLRMAASNERARRFYEKNGMKRTGQGTHPRTGIPVHFYGWNAVEPRKGHATRRAGSQGTPPPPAD